MPNIFSHPAYPVSDNYSVVGYNLQVSRAKGNTNSGSSVVSGAGSVTVTPVSMTNITLNAFLDIEPGTANYESVQVTAVTSTTFTATFTLAHTAGFVIQSKAVSPAYYGPWQTIQTAYTQNLSIYDAGGHKFDLYRVQPIVQQYAGFPNQGPKIYLDYSKAFYAWTPLYDAQISSLIDHFRLNFIDDIGVRSTDSTVVTESTGQGVMPFITDANTARFYLSFLPNTDPIKFREFDLMIMQGASPATASPMVPYQDYFPNLDGGFIDFATNPAANNYLRVEYTRVEFTDDECRKAILNAVSELGLFGITDQTYNVIASNNYFYLQQPLPNRDLAQIVLMIAQKNLLGSRILSSFKASEAWKDGRIEYTADPSRSIQAGTAWHSDLRDQINMAANNYIINTRQYFSRGEFDSFFDNSGMLYPPFSVYNVFNYMSWWI